MDIVKMSPLTALLAEEEKKRERGKKKLTLLPSIARFCAFVFFFFFSYVACMETTGEQKHHHRERRPMMHSANERAPRFFFVMCSSVCQYTFLSHIFFYARCLHGAAENKRNERPLSYSYIYTQQKSSWSFFFDESDKPDRKSLNQVAHGVKKQEKKWIWFYI